MTFSIDCHLDEADSQTSTFPGRGFGRKWVKSLASSGATDVPPSENRPSSSTKRWLAARSRSKK
jgi:hypothetical protein